jgi:hypothetical protein
MKGCDLMLMVLTKDNSIKIIKSTNENYTIEDRKLIFNIKNFNSSPKFLLGILFETIEELFVECVKISYRYMVIH